MNSLTRCVAQDAAIVLGLGVGTAARVGAQDAQPRMSAGLAAEFPAGIEWQRIEGRSRAIETRFGELTIEPGDLCPPGPGERFNKVDIRLDGTLISAIGCTVDGDYYIVAFKNRFELGPTDVVLLGANAGGSGSPPERLHLVVLDPAREPRIEMDPNFRSSFGTERVAADGARLWFDLDYLAGERKVAVFDGESLQIGFLPAEPVQLSRQECEAAYSTLLDCMQRGRGKDYSAYSLAEFLGDYGTLSNASRGTLIRLSNRPGFRGDAYMQICAVTAQVQLQPSYEAFEAQICPQ